MQRYQSPHFSQIQYRMQNERGGGGGDTHVSIIVLDNNRAYTYISTQSANNSAKCCAMLCLDLSQQREDL